MGEWATHWCALNGPPSAPEPSEAEVEFARGIDAAARFVEKRLADYDAAHGSTDSDTGAREYPGTGDEYVCELAEIAEAIRALAPPPPAEPTHLACGHPAELLLHSAETGEPLYCELCDDKSGRRDAETRESELTAENAELRRRLDAAQPAPQPKPSEAARMYIDGEWNSYRGDLLSLALVGEDGCEWYEVLEFDGKPDPWVAANVMPKLRKAPVSLELMQGSLQRFLDRYPAGVHIVADWPEDIERFCRVLVTGPGQRLGTPPLTMEVVRIEPVSADPHNALADARALRDALRAAAAARGR